MGLNPEDKIHVDHKDGDGLNIFASMDLIFLLCIT